MMMKEVHYFTPLHNAIGKLCENKIIYSEIIDLLLAYGACANKGSFSPLVLALQNDDEYGYEIMKKLIKHGADVNYVSKIDGDAPLHIAVQWGDQNKIQLLLEAGADPSLRSNTGITPREVANNEEIRSLLKNYKKKLPFQLQQWPFQLSLSLIFFIFITLCCFFAKKIL